MSALRRLVDRFLGPAIVIVGDRVVIHRAPRGLTLQVGGAQIANGDDDDDPVGRALERINENLRALINPDADKAELADWEPGIVPVRRDR